MSFWMQTAKSLIGVKEVPGTGNSSIIMGWANKVKSWLGIDYNADSIPWCGLFVTYVLNQAKITPAKISVRAKSWATWGVALSKPSYGAVLVFEREGGGHVGFYVSEDSTNYHVLGGNQSDAVNITKIAKSRCIAIRWPKEVALPTSGPVIANLSGAVSKNEA